MQTVQIQILNRWTSAVIHEAQVSAETPDYARMKAAVKSALESGADLTGANLTRADLTGANLTDADLTRANLTRADLTGANLTDANLTGANLTRANLTGAKNASAKADVFTVLDSAPNEVGGLLLALRSGRVDGSTYNGECACLVGTIANVRHCAPAELGPLIPMDSTRPAERWFMGISQGQTPSNNPIASLTEEWIVEWLRAHGQNPDRFTPEFVAMQKGAAEERARIIALLPAGMMGQAIAAEIRKGAV